ncbi:MAG: MFS transporter [Thermoplasmata archaeon]
MKNKKILLLFLISTLSQFPLSMIRFIIPIYAKNIGANLFILGMMGSAYGLVYILLAAYFGRISEKFGHRKMIFLGLLIYALVILIYPFIKDPFYLIFIRGGEAVGMAMVWPSIEAFSQFANGERLEHSIMVYTLSWSIAASIAPYTGALFIHDFLMAILIIFLITIFGSFISYFIPYKYNISIQVNKKDVNLSYEILIPIFIYGFNSSVILSFYPAFGTTINLGAYGSGIIMMFSGAFMVLAFILSGIFFHKIDNSYTLILGLILQFFLFSVAWYHGFYAQLVSMSLIYFGEGLIYFNVLLNIVNSFPKNVGYKTGLFESSIGLGSIFFPLIGGLPSTLGYDFPWLVSFTVSFIIFVIYLIHLIT